MNLEYGDRINEVRILLDGSVYVEIDDEHGFRLDFDDESNKWFVGMVFGDSKQ